VDAAVLDEEALLDVWRFNLTDDPAVISHGLLGKVCLIWALSSSSLLD